MLNRLEMLRIFCAAVEAGNFKEAAYRLAISPQTVTRAIKELEHLQGEMLFHRNTRNVQVTQVGAELAIQARMSLQHIDQLFERRSPQKNPEIRGRVRITTSIAFGRSKVMPIVTALMRENPELDIDLSLNDAQANVIDEKIDIGLRIGFMRDNRFVARRLAKIYFRVVAAPGLVAQVGAPKKIEELKQLPTTAVMDYNTGRLWPWIFKSNKYWTPEHPRFTCDDAEAELDALIAGAGYGQVLGFLADEKIRAGTLEVHLEKFAPEPWDLYIYRPQRGPVPARIRLVYDRLIKELSESN